MRRGWLLCLILAACAEDLAKPELIADLRILGLKAEPPEATVGTEVALDALVVTPDAAAQIELAWRACVATSNQAGPEECTLAAPPTVSCDEAPEAAACLLGRNATASYRLPAKALEGRAAGQDGEVFIVLVAVDRASMSLAQCTAAIVGSSTVPDGCRVAAKRVSVTAAMSATPNTNPTVLPVTIAGESVSVEVPATAADETSDGPESLFLSWFVTAGELDSFRTDAAGAGLMNSWTPADAAGRIFVVVRDGRGGESWVGGTR